jgi:hypothetical protein
MSNLRRDRNAAWCVYVLFNLAGVPRWVGATSRIDERMRGHHLGTRNNSHDNLELKALGDAGFTVEIAFIGMNQKQAYEKERMLIAKYGRQWNGSGLLYNKAAGGPANTGYSAQKLSWHVTKCKGGFTPGASR